MTQRAWVNERMRIEIIENGESWRKKRVEEKNDYLVSIIKWHHIGEWRNIKFYSDIIVLDIRKVFNDPNKDHANNQATLRTPTQIQLFDYL